MQPKHPHDWDQIHNHIRQQLGALFAIDDTRGFELFVLLQRTARLARALDSQPDDGIELSGPRWQVLLRLFIEGQAEGCAGLTPTDISRSQRVSKNAISALLRGLESQGLIQRALDPADLRAFRIQLTDAGRDYVLANAPQRFAAIDRLLDGLEPAEQDQLIALLTKLQHSLIDRVHVPAPESALDEE